MERVRVNLESIWVQLEWIGGLIGMDWGPM
jgi:hypothetical protein